MATLQELEAALVKADAAGNAEDARALAGYVREARAQKAAPAPQQDYVDPRSQAPLGQSGVLRGAGIVADHISQGAKTLVYGAGQAASALADLPGKLPLIPDTDHLGRFNEATEQLNQNRERQFQETYGSQPNKWADAGATVGLSLALNPKQAATTAWGLVGNAAKVGALSSGTAYIPDASLTEKGLWTAGGGLLGGLIGGVPAAWLGAKNKVRGFFQRPGTAEAADAAATVQQAVPALKGKLTYGQQTGNPQTVGMESKVAGPQAQRLWVEQAKEVQTEMGAIANKYGPQIAPEEAVLKGQLALQNQQRAMREVRSTLWKSDIAAIRAKVTTDVFDEAGVASSREVGVELPGLNKRLNAIIADFKGDSLELAPQVQLILKRAKDQGGLLRFDDLDELLQRMNGNGMTVLNSLNPGANKAAGAQMQRAIFESLDEMPANSEVGTLLRGMRDGYKARSLDLAKFEGAAAAKILGLELPPGAVPEPERALDALLGLGRTELGNLKTVLQGQDPALLDSLRGATLRRAVDQSVNTNTRAGTPLFDIKTFLGNTVENGQLRAAGLFSKGQEAELTKSVMSLRSLLNSAPFKAEALDPNRAVTSVVTRSLAFLTMNILRTGNLEKVFFDTTTRATFQNASRLADLGKTSQAINVLAKAFPESYTDSQGQEGQE